MTQLIGKYMSKFIVKGGSRLQGSVRVQGSKNAAFPVMAACILAGRPCVIQNVPEIADVDVFVRILNYLGAKTKFAAHILNIDTRNLRNRPLPADLVGKLRGSLLFAGSLLGRFGKVVLPRPGGDAIGARPIDVHLDGFRKLGAVVRESKNLLSVKARKLRGGKVVLGVTSVTGTENIILAAATAVGTTVIKLAAAEPHVQDLCRFLNELGARIEGIGTSTLTIRGVRRLGGAKHRLCGDEIVAATWCVAAAATKGQVTITGVDPETLDAPIAVLERMGVNISVRTKDIVIGKPKQPYKSVRVITGVYPQLLTDMQPLLGVLATQCAGRSSIHDWIYEGRQGYLRSLRKMGARVEFDDVHRSRIYGPVKLRGAEIKTPDLRAGASILIAALVARGESVIYNAEIIDRGYEKIDEKLRELGAKVQRAE